MDGDVPPYADAGARPSPRRGHAAADHHEAGRPGLAGRSGLQPRLLGRGRRARAPLRRAVLYSAENGLNVLAFPSIGVMQHDIVSNTASLLGADDPAAGGAVEGYLTSGGTESLLQAVKTARDVGRDRGIGAAAGGGGRERARRLHQGGRLLRRRAGPGAGGRGLPGQCSGAGRGLQRRHHHGGRVRPDVSPGGDRPHCRHRRAGVASAASCATSTPAWAASSCPS